MKSINLHKLLIPILTAALFVGCVKEVVTDVDSNGMATVSYSVDGMQAGTYATSAEGHELAVNDIHILFYQTSEGSAGRYITYQHATVAHGTSSFSFPIPEVLATKTDYQTIIVGNAHDFAPTSHADFDAYLNTYRNLTYDQAKQKLYAEVNNRNILSLPMWGQLVDGSNEEIPFRFESRVNTTIAGTIRLSRSICRLDLKNYAAKKLNIAWVKVCNYRSQGFYFHNDALSGEIKPGISSVPPTGSQDGYVRVAAPSNGTQQLQAQLYAFPNTVPIVVQNDNQTTYLMIAGYYQDDSGEANTSELTYYRFNMAERGSSQILKRNQIYRASIMGVKGPGATTEQGAKDETTPLFEQQVDEGWEGGETGGVTDEFGNFLFLSTTQVNFDGGVKDLSKEIKVKVRAGMTWEVVAAHGPDDHADAFSFMTSGANSFRIITLVDNASNSSYTGQLKVVATTPEGTTLELPVSLIQLSSAEEAHILLVDGREGTLNYQIADSGGMLSLQVQTGSSYTRWTVEDSGNSFREWIGTSFTKSGAHNGFLTITAPANGGTSKRTATLIVHRTGAKDVIIKLTQAPEEQMITISPMPTDGLLTLEGFSVSPTNRNGLSTQTEFWVMVDDPANYSLDIASDFDSNHDLILTSPNALSLATLPTFPGTSATSTLTNLKNGVRFWVNVFRTGPGDPTIKGKIKITAVPKRAGLPAPELTLNVDIVTSCILDDVLIDSILVADRAVGTPSRINEEGKFIPALNFSNLPNLQITGYPNADGENTQFKGPYYTWHNTNPPTFCPTEYADKNVDEAETYSPYYKSADRNKWHTPTREAAQSIASRIMLSKFRVYIVADQLNDEGKYVGCFFPLSGYGGLPNNPCSYFWATTRADNFRAYSFYSYSDHRYGVTYDFFGEQLSARCVRTI